MNLWILLLTLTAAWGDSLTVTLPLPEAASAHQEMTKDICIGRLKTLEHQLGSFWDSPQLQALNSLNFDDLTAEVPDGWLESSIAQGLMENPQEVATLAAAGLAGAFIERRLKKSVQRREAVYSAAQKGQLELRAELKKRNFVRDGYSSQYIRTFKKYFPAIAKQMKGLKAGPIASASANAETIRMLPDASDKLAKKRRKSKKFLKKMNMSPRYQKLGGVRGAAIGLTIGATAIAVRRYLLRKNCNLSKEAAQAVSVTGLLDASIAYGCQGLRSGLQNLKHLTEETYSDLCTGTTTERESLIDKIETFSTAAIRHSENKLQLSQLSEVCINPEHTQAYVEMNNKVFGFDGFYTEPSQETLFAKTALQDGTQISWMMNLSGNLCWDLQIDGPSRPIPSALDGAGMSVTCQNAMEFFLNTNEAPPTLQDFRHKMYVVGEAMATATVALPMSFGICQRQRDDQTQ